MLTVNTIRFPMRLFCFLALSIALMTGCVGPREVAAPSPWDQSAETVNAGLDGQRVTIELWSGKAYQGAGEVYIAGDSLFFTPDRVWPAEQPVHLTEVQRISYVRGRKANKGALIGAVPGLLIIGSGLLVDDSDSVISGDIIALAGVGYLAIGSTIGALIGQWTAPGERVVVYESSLRTVGPDSDLAQPTPSAERDAQSP